MRILPPGWQPRAGVAAAFGLLLAFMGLLAYVDVDPSERRPQWLSPRISNGDEAEYLLVVNSILLDHDLELGTDYQRVRDGEALAGKAYRGKIMVHHSIVYSPSTGEHELIIKAFNLARTRPCSVPGCIPFPRIGDKLAAGGPFVEVSAHPVGFPALVAALLAFTFPGPEQVEERMGLVVLLLTWLATVATYLAARRMGLGRGAAVASAGLLALASPWLAYSRAYFSEATGGLFLTLALWAAQRLNPVAAGVFLVVAISTKPVYCLIGVGFIAAAWIAGRRRDALLLTTVLGVGGLGIAAFNVWLCRTIAISGNRGWEGIDEIYQVFQTFIDLRHGLFLFVPWAVPALACVILRWARPPRGDGYGRLAAALGLGLYLALLCVFGNLGAACYGPRYWVPVLPWLAVAAVELALSRRWLRVILWLLALVSLGIAIPGAILYRHDWNWSPMAPLLVLLGR